MNYDVAALIVGVAVVLIALVMAIAF